jgi:hypothetical protein
MADLNMLKSIAARTGLGLKFLSKDEKISIMLEQLREVFPEAIFKGGTALNRVYLSRLGVSRFSEDIDLNFIRDATLEDNIATIVAGMSRIKGFDVSKPRLQVRTLRFDCGFDSELGGKDQIKVEFYINPVRSLKTEDVLVKSPFVETHPAIFRTYSMEDLIAQKFMALYNRTEGKDIYDIFYALDLDYTNNQLSEALVLAREYYHIPHAGFVDGTCDKLAEANMNCKYIQQSTNHFIPSSLRPEWKMFIETLSFKIRNKMQ